MIGVAVAIFFATAGRMIAIGLGVVGLVFLLFSGSGSNKGGYRF